MKDWLIKESYDKSKLRPAVCKPEHAYTLGKEGKWRSILSDTEDHRKDYIPAFRAYFLPNKYTADVEYTTEFVEYTGGAGEGDESTIDWTKKPDSYESDTHTGNTSIQPLIRTIDADGTVTYYDLQGRRLNSKFKGSRVQGFNKGVYISNGKKVIK